MRSAILFVALALATGAQAQTVRCSTFGDATRCTGPGGYASRETQFGDWTNGSDSRGNSWRTSQFGDTTTTQITPGSRPRSGMQPMTSDFAAGERPVR
jgi:hypothetical protein